LVFFKIKRKKLIVYQSGQQKKKEERKKRIVELLQEKSKVSNNDVEKLLGVICRNWKMKKRSSRLEKPDGLFIIN